MRFWDTSALVCLLIDHPRTDFARGLLARDESVAVWWSTPLECWSAIARHRRERTISAEVERVAQTQLDALRSVWHEVLPSDEVRRQARRLLNTHRLRAGEALQLAAAIVWSSSYGEGDFVTFDAVLREAAHLEGFAVV